MVPYITFKKTFAWIENFDAFFGHIARYLGPGRVGVLGQNVIVHVLPSFSPNGQGTYGSMPSAWTGLWATRWGPGPDLTRPPPTGAFNKFCFYEVLVIYILKVYLYVFIRACDYVTDIPFAPTPHRSRSQSFNPVPPPLGSGALKQGYRVCTAQMVCFCENIMKQKLQDTPEKGGGGDSSGPISSQTSPRCLAADPSSRGLPQTWSLGLLS